MNKNNEKKPPKVFISYSWSNTDHMNQVLDLAYKLNDDGVHVVIDEWDAPEGCDLYAFMERNVTSKEIDHVLIISDKKYAEKANNREGGVGTETQVISKQVYDDVNQTKFIPILWERNENGETYLPNYLISRRYIDFTNEHRIENYEKLVRRIYNLPENPRPPLGKLSLNKYTETDNYPKLRNITGGFEYNINKDKNMFTNIVQDFLEEFYTCLKTFKVDLTEISDINKLSTKIYDNLNSYKPLRDYFIEFFEQTIKKNLQYPMDYDIIIDFFVKIYSLTQPIIGESYNTKNIINFDFMMRELFLYLIAIALKYGNYNFISELLNSPYYFEYVSNSLNDAQSFVNLDNRGEIKTDAYLTRYYNTIEEIPLTGLGKLLTDRLHNNYSIDNLVDADLLCCYISVLNSKEHDWFPFTYIYKSSDYFTFFRKLTSKRYFEKVKCIFDVNSINDLKKKIIQADQRYFTKRYKINNCFKKVEPISSYVNLENLGTER